MLRTALRLAPIAIARLPPRLLRPKCLICWLTALSLAVPCFMLILGGFILFDLRTDAWNRSEQASDNLILALSRDIGRSINVYDLSLQGTMHAMAEPALIHVDAKVRHMALFDTASTAEFLGTMLVVNAEGDVIADSTALDPHKLNMNSREPFLVHKRRPDVGLFVSHAFLSRLQLGPIVVLTRRLANPDGSFAGVVEGSIRTAYFQHLFEQLDVGPSGSVTLSRIDGRVIARRPYRAEDIDMDLGNTATFQAFLDAPHGHFVDASPFDHVRRLYTFHKVDGLPLILTVGIAVEDIYAPWRRKAIGIGAILTALWISSIALCLLSRREILRRIAAETSLQEAAQHLALMAATDGLTGIPNRRSFEVTLAREWRRAIRAETQVALLMIDIDHFKQFNDHYGHQAGDEALHAVAICIANTVRRPTDIAARYGGEEFVVLLAETELSGARAVAEATRVAVADQAISHVLSPLGRLSISIGVAIAHPAIGDDVAVLVKQADDALYQAKRGGRDQVASRALPDMHLRMLDSVLQGAIPKPG